MVQEAWCRELDAESKVKWYKEHSVGDMGVPCMGQGAWCRELDAESNLKVKWYKEHSVGDMGVPCMVQGAWCREHGAEGVVQGGSTTFALQRNTPPSAIAPT
jgi:hypothetical protein